MIFKKSEFGGGAKYPPRVDRVKKDTIRTVPEHSFRGGKHKKDEST
jgi:hypothetical protein